MIALISPGGLNSEYRVRVARWLVLFVTLFVAAQSRSQSVLVENVTIVDVTSGLLLPDQMVLIEGNRISRIGTELDVPEDSEIVDGRGRYLIPGLWDMHVHATWPTGIETYYALFIANGVTGIRDMWGVREPAASAEEAIKRGEMVGPPRAVVAGNLVDGPARIWPGSQIALNPADGRRIVDSLQAVGAPFVKVYSSLSPETYRGIAERAQQLRYPFVGHVPSGVRVADASAFGQRSMEHFYGVLEGCSSQEDAILQEYERALAEDTARTWSDVNAERIRHSLATQDEAKCRDLASTFISNETWQVPTLVTNRGYVFMRELAAGGDERLRYMPPADYNWWFPESNDFARNQTEDDWARGAATYAREMEIVRLMAELGVPFLAGSDTSNPWAFPGFGLHDELELLVEAGLTPLQALRAATLNPARFFNRTSELGTVEVGKLADLVLLNANPLEDIANTQEIEAVIADGRLYHRVALDNILERLATEYGRRSIADVVLEVMESEGIEAARQSHRALIEGMPDSLRFGESELNGLGYTLLGQERIEQAIAVFEMNVAAYPNAPNTYDSLADALVAADRSEEARDAILRAVELARIHEDPRLPFYLNRLEFVEEQMRRGHE